ncbi:MAG: LON peptidase substrate-binding domain-containing protein, partial [Candidatus Binatia bacterium]
MKNTLRMIPLDEIVVFPGMDLTLPLDTGAQDTVVLVPRRGNEYSKVGVVAKVKERVRLPGIGSAVAISGLHRAIVGAAEALVDGGLQAQFEPHPDVNPAPVATAELDREYRAIVHEILELRGDDGRIAAFLRGITDAGALADTSGYSPDLTFEQKVKLLETLDVVERLKLAIELQRGRLMEL